MTLAQRINFVQNLLYFPALTVQMFVRRKTGFRHLKPTPILVMTVIMIAFALAAGNTLATATSDLGSPTQDANIQRLQQQVAQLPFDAAPPPGQIVRDRYAWAQKHILSPAQQQERRRALDEANASAAQKAQQSAEWRARLARWPLILFALAFFAWAHIQRWQRWHDICNGVRWHSRTRGVSYLAPFLGGILNESQIVRFADPLLCALVGLLCTTISRALGVWIFFAAIALYIVEDAVFQRQLDQMLDQLDGMVDGEVAQTVQEHFTQGTASQKPLSLEQTAGIPTAIAPDLAARIAERRAAKAARQARTA
jgi:hypothetical protein